MYLQEIHKSTGGPTNKASFSDDLKTLLALPGEKLIPPDYCCRSAARRLEAIFSGRR